MSEARERANQAQTELRAYGAAIDEVRKELITQWLETKPQETGLREAIWRSVKNLDQVRQLVQSAASTATVLDRRNEIRDTLRAV